jgi:CheY-like chemotaxis protein
MSFSPLRVLIVDDAASTRRLVRGVLEAASVEVVGEAGSGQAAIESASLLRPDVVLLDLSLPDGDGSSVLPQLLQVAPGVNVIVLSHAAQAAGPRLVSEGAIGFISKGLEPEALLDQLSEVLGVPLVVGRAEGIATSSKPACGLFYHDDIDIRRSINAALASSWVDIVSEVVATGDVLSVLCSAIATTRPNVVVVGDIKETPAQVVFPQLQLLAPDAAFISYTLHPPQPAMSFAGNVVFVEQPDVERLTACVRGLPHPLRLVPNR